MTRYIRPGLLLLLLAAVYLSVGAESASAQDRMVLVTGVSLAGEIKSASRGKVSFDNDELDVVSVDVEDIAVLVSPRFFEVHDDFGQIFRGALQPADSGQVRVAGPDGSATVRIADIVEILAFENGFWGRTSGYLDVGATVARANFLRSLSLGSRFGYRGPRVGFSVSWDAYWQTQTSQAPDGTEFEDAARRATLRTNFSRYLGRWTAQASATGEKNDELDLEGRLQLGVQGIYTFVENAALEMSAGGGLVSNTETYVGEETNNSAEVVVGAGLDVFDLGAVDIYTLVQTFTNLSEERYRLSFDGRIAWEIIDDFFLNFNVNENLDSRPPSEGSRKRDYRYGFSVGWSWN
jgi:hypothetical protein